MFDQVAIEQFEIGSLTLMENAARAATDCLCQFQGRVVDQGKGADQSVETSRTSSVVILCGRGNNGGDGLVMARHLHLRGWNTKVILLSNPENLSPDSGTNFRILKHTKVPIVNWPSLINDAGSKIEEHLAGFDWIVDAMLGTGSKPPLRSPMDDIVRIANQQPAKRLAIDLPSGLECDLTECEMDPGDQTPDWDDQAVFKADLTVTFVARKPVMETKAGKRYCGEIRIMDIGAPLEVFDWL